MKWMDETKEHQIESVTNPDSSSTEQLQTVSWAIWSIVTLSAEEKKESKIFMIYMVVHTRALQKQV